MRLQEGILDDSGVTSKLGMDELEIARRENKLLSVELPQLTSSLYVLSVQSVLIVICFHT